MCWDHCLFLDPAARSCDFAGAHEITNVLLQELVVTVELVMLLANGLYAVEDVDEGVLQSFGVSLPRLALGLVAYLRV